MFSYQGLLLVETTSLVSDAWNDLQDGRIVLRLGGPLRYLWLHKDGDDLRYALQEGGGERPDLVSMVPCANQEDVKKLILDRLFQVARPVEANFSTPGDCG